MWSGNNEIGRESPFAPDANNRQMVLKMAEWGEPRNWTVSLGMQYDRNLTPSTVFSVAAEIQFGIGGTVQTVEIDWLQGAAITVPANSIVINALYPFNAQFPANTTVPDDLILRASLSRHPIANACPTRSNRQTFPTSVDTIVDVIPPFAKNLQIALGGISGAVDLFAFYTNTLISFRYESSSTFVAVPAALYQGTQLLSFIDFTNELLGAPLSIPIPEGARSVALVWAPGGVPAAPPALFAAQFRYEIGL